MRARRGTGAIAVAAVGLLVVLLGTGSALRLALAAVVGGAYLADPLVKRVLDHASPGLVPEGGVDYEAATDLASRDFRYPYRQAQARWLRESGRPPDLAGTLLANEDFSEAVRRAPSFASARYYFAVSSLSLGETEEADRNALAALELAPLHQDLRKRVARYFEERFRETRSEEHLASAFRAMGSERGALIRSVIEDPMLTYDRVVSALDVSKVRANERLEVLVSMGRWDWAIRAAGDLDGVERDTGRYEGAVRVMYSNYLSGRGAKEAALREAEAGAELLGTAFRGHSVLARARLLTGNVESGLAALTVALREGLSVPGVEAIIREAGPEGQQVVSFWEAGSREVPDDVSISLALSRAYLDAGRPLDARRTLKGLLDRNVAYAEANFIMAQTFYRSGNRLMALPYARKSHTAEPTESRYATLVELLEQEPR